MTRRLPRHLAILLIVASVSASVGLGDAAANHAPEDAVCIPGAVVTAYSAEQYPGRTSDGTITVQAVRDGQYIAAASYRIPMGATVELDNHLAYRVADRGLLDEHGITVDVLMATTAEARQWGARRMTVCWWM